MSKAQVGYLVNCLCTFFFFFLLSFLCRLLECHHALPTSGCKSTFMFASLSFSVLGSNTWSLSLGTAAHTDWIPFIDMLGMADLTGEITVRRKSGVCSFSFVSEARITAHFNTKIGALQMSRQRCEICEVSSRPRHQNDYQCFVQNTCFIRSLHKATVAVKGQWCDPFCFTTLFMCWLSSY